jgi:predicted Zn-dependent protease
MDADAACNNLGVIFWQRGDRTGSTAYFNKALDKNPSYRPAVINYARILKEMDRKEEIARLCKAYLKDHPGDQEIVKMFAETGLSFIDNN